VREFITVTLRDVLSKEKFIGTAAFNCVTAIGKKQEIFNENDVTRWVEELQAVSQA